MKRLRVSDHAVLRYLERHGGFEIEKLRADMERRLTPLFASGAHRVQFDGLVFVARGTDEARTVTTVLDRDRAAPQQLQEDGDG